MIFAKIDFINLLPFYIFIKKNINSSQIKQIINYKKSYPSVINKQFKKRSIDAAFISSIKSKRCKCLDLGIVAKKEVLSVLALKGDFKKDQQSDTSNALALALDIKGEILIGDKALHYYHNSNDKDFIDLAKLCIKTSAAALVAINELDELLETAFSSRERKIVDKMIQKINDLELGLII